MRVNLKSLEKVVTEERSVAMFRQEVKRVLGDSVYAEGTLKQVVKEANERLDVLEKTGRLNVSFDQKIINKLLEHSDVDVRKFVARTIDKNKLQRFVNDKSDTVRLAAAKRLPLSIVSEMVKRFPFDDQLSVLKKQKQLSEGLPDPKITKVSNEKKKLGAAVKQYAGDELSDLWYKEKALKYVADYGGNIEDGWEEVTAHRFVSSTKATSGVEIDEKKLLDAIKKELEARDDRALGDTTLRETIKWLSKSLNEESEIVEYVEEDEEIDEIKDLVESNVSRSDYISEAVRLFNVKFAQLPASIRKFRMNEVNSVQEIPAVGMVPDKRGFTPIVERALNTLCRNWTEKQVLNGESLKLEWGTHPIDENKICFTVVMK